MLRESNENMFSHCICYARAPSTYMSHAHVSLLCNFVANETPRDGLTIVNYITGNNPAHKVACTKPAFRPFGGLSSDRPLYSSTVTNRPKIACTWLKMSYNCVSNVSIMSPSCLCSVLPLNLLFYN